MQVSSSRLKSRIKASRHQVMTDYATELVEVVDAAYENLSGLSDERASWRRAPNSWSIKEVVGHLIDSASNNHERFLRARFQDNLKFPGYDQNAWVAAQQYQDAPFQELLSLWRLFNRQIARVMTATPEAIRMRKHASHNFHEIAWKTVPENVPATLEYFMRDYVGHLKHHVVQINTLITQSLERRGGKPQDF